MLVEEMQYLNSKPVEGLKRWSISIQKPVKVDVDEAKEGIRDDCNKAENVWKRARLVLMMVEEMKYLNSKPVDGWRDDVSQFKTSWTIASNADKKNHLKNNPVSRKQRHLLWAQ